jgi:type III secretory pathway component EscS
MRIVTFTFKNEAVWILIFSIAPTLIGVVVGLIVWLLR